MEVDVQIPFRNWEIRPWREGDYQSAYQLWKHSGLTLGVSDREAEISRLVKRNPALALVAETGGRVVGTVLGGFDGRRGIIHHLAVSEPMRNRGIARELIHEIESRMKEMRIVKINFWIEARSESLVSFYQKLGYQQRDLITISKSLNPEEPLA